MIFLKRLMQIGTNFFVFAAVIFMTIAIHYWAGDAQGLRTAAGIAAGILLLYLWFGLARRFPWARHLTLGGIIVFFALYATKTPVSDTWVPLHQRTAAVNITENKIEISNFRDSLHEAGQSATVVWTEQTFDLSKLTGAKLILQPFGSSVATVHALLTFEFSDGNHLAVSVEARRTSWDHFDPIAGLFRHDHLYLVLGSERDLIWKRLARDTPFDLYFFEITAPLSSIRDYLRAVLSLAQHLSETPQFYSTMSDSCFSTLVKLAPAINEAVPWYDYRRFVPGASISLLQEYGLVDASVSEDMLTARSKLKTRLRPPSGFNDSNAWSEHLRSGIRAD